MKAHAEGWMADQSLAHKTFTCRVCVRKRRHDCGEIVVRNIWPHMNKCFRRQSRLKTYSDGYVRELQNGQEGLHAVQSSP